VNDPAIQFCLMSARRNLGDFETARTWYREFVARQPDGPWRRLGMAELWLTSPTAAPPVPVLTSRASDARPYLDGKLDDVCWQAAPVARLGGAGGAEPKDHPTEVRVRHDGEFLYLAVRCGHPAGAGTPAAKVKTRDADLSGQDRVSLLLDLDRDFGTYFHF